MQLLRYFNVILYLIIAYLLFVGLVTLYSKLTNNKIYKTLNVYQINHFYLFMDWIMTPVMFIFSGFNSNDIQESHMWHMQNVSPEIIDKSKACYVAGSDSSIYGKGTFLFHVYMAGGWKDYVVLEIVGDTKFWHIGWISDSTYNTNEIHKLKIYDKRIRLLRGQLNKNYYAFAINDNSEQISIRIVGEGKLGDNKFSKIRIF